MMNAVVFCSSLWLPLLRLFLLFSPLAHTVPHTPSHACHAVTCCVSVYSVVHCILCVRRAYLHCTCVCVCDSPRILTLLPGPCSCRLTSRSLLHYLVAAYMTAMLLPEAAERAERERKEAAEKARLKKLHSIIREEKKKKKKPKIKKK